MSFTTGNQFEQVLQMIETFDKSFKILKCDQENIQCEFKPIGRNIHLEQSYYYLTDYFYYTNGEQFYYIDGTIKVNTDFCNRCGIMADVTTMCVQTNTPQLTFDKVCDLAKDINGPYHDIWFWNSDGIDFRDQSYFRVYETPVPLVGLKNGKYFEEQIRGNIPTQLQNHIAKHTYKPVLDCACSSTSPVS